MPGEAYLQGVLRHFDDRRLGWIIKGMRANPDVEAPVDYAMAQRAFPGVDQYEAQVMLWEFCDAAARGDLEWARDRDGRLVRVEYRAHDPECDPPPPGRGWWRT